MENNCNIVDLLVKNATLYPETIALIKAQKSISYHALEQRSQQYATFFKKKGLVETDVALLMIHLSIEFYAIFLGLTRINVCVMLLDPGVGAAYLKSCCESINPSVWIATPRAEILNYLPEIRKIPKRFSTSKLGWLWGGTVLNTIKTAKNNFQDERTPPHHPALITFTSGSTGQPKGIVRTHGFLKHQNQVIAQTLRSQAGEVQLSTLPVFILAHLAQGVTTVLPNPHFSKMLSEIHQFNIQHILAAPVFCAQLSLALKTLDLKTIFTGGGPVFPNTLRLLHSVFPKTQITAVYGSTEAEPIAELMISDITPQDWTAIETGAGLLAGTPIKHIQLAILPDAWGTPMGPFHHADDFRQQCLESHRVGEILVSGQHVITGYLNPDHNIETKCTVDDTIWHRTGDAGYIDHQGRLWLLGRCSAKIKTPSGFLYPFAVEAAAMSDPAIQMAAFVQVKGQKVLAIVLADPKTPPKTDFLKTHFQLDKICRVEKIPMDKRHHSKVLYTALSDMLSKTELWLSRINLKC
jgi:acyl-CoA synthetase (AMP-forming)/AMP-acid ligase II